MINTSNSIILILIAAAVTFMLRAFPFVIFAGKRKMPKLVKKVAGILPTAIMAVLVIYCLKADIAAVKEYLLTSKENLVSPISSLLAILTVSIVHLWKRNTLLSIAVGTIVYMLLLRII